MTDPTELRRLLDGLLERRKTRPFSPEEAAAASESAFRIAVHPLTEVAEAFALLQRAIRWDKANPKYAFHLARLCFVHGQLERSAQWLRVAQQVCPTSHRVWAHIALLQNRLDEQFEGNPQYEQGFLRQQSSDLLSRVREGKDEFSAELLVFEPPKVEPAKQSGERAPTMPPSELGDSNEPSFYRIIDSGRCRWSGVHDLSAETLLDAQSSEYSRDKLRDPLVSAANHSGSRVGGQAAFVILAIEWVVAGYSPGFVRQLASQVLTEGKPASAMFEIACELAEANPKELPGLLAAALERGEIPPLLAAAFHQRRVLGAPLRTRTLAQVVYAARDFLAAIPSSADSELATPLVADLRRSAQELEPVFSSPVADYPMKADISQILSPSAKIEAIRHEAEEIDETLGSYRKRLGELLPSPKAELLGMLLVEANRIRDYVNALPDRVKRLLSELDEVRTSGKAPEEMLTLIEAAQERLRGLSPKLGPVRKALRSVPELAGAAEDPPRPSLTSSASNGAEQRTEALRREASDISSALDSHRNRLIELLPSPKTELVGDLLLEANRIRQFVGDVQSRVQQALAEIDGIRTSGKSSEGLIAVLETVQADLRGLSTRLGPLRKLLRQVPEIATGDASAHQSLSPSAGPSTASGATVVPLEGRAAIEQALQEVERRLAGSLDQALGSFRCYTPQQMRMPELRALHQSVRARHAEVLFRIGEKAAARRMWISIANEDQLLTAPLRNIAVCDSLGRDERQKLVSWKAFVEMLYFKAVACGQPAEAAIERSAFHREFAFAYGPPAFLPKNKDKKDKEVSSDPGAILSFLSSPGRAEVFAGHYLLSQANARWAFTSPSILLGVSRTTGEVGRERAQGIVSQFNERTGVFLPDRVSNSFRALVRRRIESSVAMCRDSRRLLTRADIDYEKNQDQYLGWLMSIAELKFRIYNEVRAAETQLARYLDNPTSLDVLRIIDRLPINASLDLLGAVARKFRTDPEIVSSLMEMLHNNIMSSVLRFAFDLDQSQPRDEPLRRRQYERLTQAWAAHPAFPDDLRDLPDDPSRLAGFYPNEVQAAFENESLDHSERAQEMLSALWEKFPHSSGIARHQAYLLINCKRFADARQVLLIAVERPISEKGRHECRKILEQIRSV